MQLAALKFVELLEHGVQLQLALGVCFNGEPHIGQVGCSQIGAVQVGTDEQGAAQRAAGQIG